MVLVSQGCSQGKQSIMSPRLVPEHRILHLSPFQILEICRSSHGAASSGALMALGSYSTLKQISLRDSAYNWTFCLFDACYHGL